MTEKKPYTVRMSPSIVTIDPCSDFNPAASAWPTPTITTTTTTAMDARRTLLLAPPSLAAHESSLAAAFAAFDRATTDLHMLDRLSAGLVTLPPAAYDLVLVLTAADGALRAEAGQLLASRAVFDRLAPAMRPGAELRAQDGGPVSDGQGRGAREAVLAGLVGSADGKAFTKPAYAEEEAVPLKLKFGAKRAAAAAAANGTAATNANGTAHSSAGPAVAQRDGRDGREADDAGHGAARGCRVCGL